MVLVAKREQVKSLFRVLEAGEFGQDDLGRREIGELPVCDGIGGQ